MFKIRKQRKITFKDFKVMERRESQLDTKTLQDIIYSQVVFAYIQLSPLKNKDQCKANDYCFCFFDSRLNEPTFYFRITQQNYRHTALLPYKLLLR